MIQAVIIDDEPKAIDLLNGYIDRIPHMQSLASFRSPLTALEFLKQTTPHVIFLDINMPELSGLSLATLISPNINIIFTTAYSEYAVKSYDLEAIDYLLKPIGFERFLKAINKIDSIPLHNDASIISLKSGYNIYRILLEDIFFLEKDGNYMIYHTKQKKILVRESIATALTKLPTSFMQVHRSFIVALKKINVVEQDGLKIEGKLIPVGHTYRAKLLKRLEL